MKNMEQGTKKVRNVTEEKIQRDSSCQQEGADTGCLRRKGRNTCGEKDLRTPQQSTFTALWYSQRANSLCQRLNCNDLISYENTDASHDGILLLKAFLVCLNTISHRALKECLISS